VAAGPGPGKGVAGASGNSPAGFPSKGASTGSRPGGNDAGAPGSSPFGSPARGSEPGKGDASGSGNSPVGILSRTKPAYPRDALQRGQEGWVKVSFTITEHGRIDNPSVVSSRPRQVFDQAALDAIMQWRFRPKMVNGKPVQTNAIQEIRFTLP
jgi:protein TonB